MHMWTRRDFLRGTAGGALGASLGLAARAAETAEPSKDAPKTTVVLARHEAALGADGRPDAKIVRRLVDQAVCRLSGKTDPAAAWRTYLRPTDTVGLKTTLYMIATSQAVIDAVRGGARQAGVPAEKISAGDRGQSPGKARKVTALINVPSLKAHHMSGIGCAIKNYIVYHASPASLHAHSCAELGAAWQAPSIRGKTRLIVVDALQPLFDKGPQVTPKYRWAYRGVLVGTDPVAVDTVCLRIIQAKRDAYKKEPWPLSPPPKSLAVADRKYHLGVSDPARIRLLKVGWDGDILI